MSLTFKGRKVVVSTQEDFDCYQKSMNEVFNHIEKKESQISFTFFQECICELLVSEPDNLYDNLIDKLDNTAIKDFCFIRPLYGIVMRNKIIQNGMFTFISKSYIWEHLKTLNIDDAVRESSFQKIKINYYCFVEITQAAKDVEKARSNADELYRKLDNTLRFMLGTNDKNMGLGIFDYRANVIGDMFCKASDNSIVKTYGQEVYTPVRPIYLDEDNWFFSCENGNERLWNILNKKGLTDIEKRLLKAVEWIGLAINERQPSIAFCQCAFAIECMLQEQKDFITKSITAQISEYAAFIVGYDKETRKEIATLFTKLYGTRSSIAHGKIIDSIGIELAEIMWLSKQIVVNFLLKQELQKISSVKELREWIVEMRYS